MLYWCSGTGQHVSYLASAFPSFTFQPTDAAADCEGSVSAYVTDLANVKPYRSLDASESKWPFEPSSYDGVLCVNMCHISPWAATLVSSDMMPMHGRSPPTLPGRASSVDPRKN